ncbi:MAG: lipid-A-disaccharide synthase N-terminal domain-containing protein [Bacteroidales bacterium]|nr:lipid-A-disaccharide synthase N-terminal domain-containing protein [Bacteroidales bacterium]
MYSLPYWIVTAIGFLAQSFFSARILIQWIKSEKTKKLESPTMYWVFSIIGSYTFVLYGLLRFDFSIILGQFVSYYIYIWNLNVKGAWMKIPRAVRYLLLLTPLVATVYAITQTTDLLPNLFQNDDRPIWLVIYGSFFQLIFSLRFVYQWYRSYKMHDSIMPTSFWVLSLIGAAGIFSYGLIIKGFDIVLIVGQGFGILAYTRNIMIGMKSKSRA